MFNRREMIVTTAGALAASTLSATATPRTIRVQMPGNAQWDADIHWLRGNRQDGHQFALRCEGDLVTDRHITLQARVDYAPTDPATFQENLFWEHENWRPGQFIGLADHYDTRDCTLAQCARNVLDAGDRGDHLTSMWLVHWGERTASIIVPDPLFTASRRAMPAGLMIADWRYVVRVANIDFFKAANNAQEIRHWMDIAMLRMPMVKHQGSAFYLSNTLLEAWRKTESTPDFDRIPPVRGVNALNTCEKTV